jgi:hypothetical protein
MKSDAVIRVSSNSKSENWPASDSIAAPRSKDRIAIRVVGPSKVPVSAKQDASFTPSCAFHAAK